MTKLRKRCSSIATVTLQQRAEIVQEELILDPADEHDRDDSTGRELNGGLDGEGVEIDFGAVKVGELHNF